jgi:hypothetical protein
MLTVQDNRPVRRVLGIRRGRRSTLLAVLFAGVAPLVACTESATEPDAAGGSVSSGSAGSGSAGSGSAGSGASNTPSSILGAWVYGVFSPTDFYNASNGQYIGNAYGTSVVFKFTSDGKYEQTVLIHSTVYSCRTQVYVYNKGTVKFNGGEFRVYPSSGRVRSSDTCNAAFNFDRADDIARKQGDKYTWSFQRNANDGKTYLMIGVGDDASALSSFRPFNE